MRLREIITTLFLTLSSGLYAQSKPQITNEDIERELNKWEAWIKKYVESDYTNKEREGFVTLKRDPPHLLEQLEKIGLTLFDAAYNPEKDWLIIPRAADEKNKKGILDSIDHELSHGLWDNVEKKGLFHWPGYQGPSLEEIAVYTKEKTNKEEFKWLRGKLRLQQDVERSAMLGKEWMQALTSYVKKIKGYKNVEDSIKENQELFKKYLTKDEINKLETLDKKVKTLYGKGQKELLKLAKEYKEFFKSFKEGLPKTVTKENFSLINEKLENMNRASKAFLEFLEKYEKLPKQIRKLDGLVDDLRYTARCRELDEQIKEAKKIKKKYPEKAKHYDETINLLERCKKHFRPIPDLTGLFEGILDRFKGSLNKLVRADNIYKIDQILNDPNEVFARMVDSLYSLHYGPVEQNKFPLNQKDLEFLKRFKYKGELLFKKAIQKYELGLEMIKDGMSPEEAKKKLEFATIFIYKDRLYAWPEAGFRIKGKIPELKFPSSKK